MMMPAAAASRPNTDSATLGTKCVMVNWPNPPMPTTSASNHTKGRRKALRGATPLLGVAVVVAAAVSTTGR